MVELQISCFGAFKVTLDGTPLTAFQTDKTRALLAYLAINGAVQQRTALLQFLWSGYSKESAQNSFRQTLHQLRQVLADAETEPPWLLLTRQTVQINPAASIRVDVLTFQELLAECKAHAHPELAVCAVCLVRLRQAVDLYQGDFLAELTVVESDPFEEWRRITQEQLHIQMLEAIAQLAAAAEAAGDDEQALQDARRQLALEPWLEDAHRRIMRLLARRGQSVAAIAQYNRCRQVLAEELGAEPDAETTALYEQIRSGKLPALRATERVTPPLQPGSKPAEPGKTPAWPVQLTPLLGRIDELTQMATLLAQPTCRLVTLVGPPGVGKTRLAQAIGDLSGGALNALSDAPTAADEVNKLKSKIQKLKFSQGLYFIDLAALRDPALLAVALAQALAAPETGLQLTEDRLIERLRDKELLLVLDNFEQVLPGVVLLNKLLMQCPQLKLLITSRVPLRMPDEQVIAVQPLPLPDLSQPVTLALVAQNVAVQLFCRRAALVVPGFILTEQLAPVVAEICRRLDGLPLAIELAATRSRLLPPPALLDRLTHRLPARLELLTSGSQVLPPRQQTLRAAIAWSYDLLDATEQQLFRQLTVFAGGATLAAIEAVIGHGLRTQATQPVAPHLPSPSLFEGIESLLDKNLLRQQELPPAWPDAEPRVIMLETIREYGWELLTTADAAANGGGTRTQQRHAEYFLAFAETAAPQLHGAAQVAWLDRLALEHDNLRAALDWFVQAGEIGKALRLATALRYFWRVRGHYREGCERLLQILARPEAAPSGGPEDAVRARALNAAGYLQWVQGKRAAAQKLLQEALTIGRAVPDAAATAFALRYLGLAAAVQQDNTTAQRLLEESLAIYRTLDHANETALALMYLGDAAFGQQTYAAAQRLYQESADLLRALGNQVVLPYALRHLGYLALVRGDLPTALGLCTESLRLNWAAGEQQGSAAALVALAAVAVASKRWAQAARLLTCVTAWLAASQAQLLPVDRSYYEQTQRLLQQQTADDGVMSNPEAPLVMEQALAYVLQEFAFVAPVGQPETSAIERAGNQASTGEKATADLGAAASHPPAELAEHASNFANNLPRFSTPLVGRAQALAEISAQLQHPSIRLLTLVGPGGMGKTRLAAEAGRERLATFADGVFFVPLAPISTADALAPAIANALGITLQGSDPESTLCQMLRQKQLLLILDNFEQLLATGTNATDLVVKLINAAPGLQMIVTSRERLKLRGEQTYAVPALTFSSTATLAEANAAAAIRLFVQSMQHMQGDFQLTAANLPAVLRICQAVQGMPLGLELAAANARGAPLTAIATALEQSAEVLSVDWRDLPERQRSMRAVFAWSWQLLNAEEQRILRQCAVFRGGFTYAAVQAVTGATLPFLTRLVDKSLLQWQVTATGEGRYTFHELLRQFAAEQLAALAAEQEKVAAQHREFYLNYLAVRELRLTRAEPRAAAAEIQEELDNIRQAWQCAVQRRDFSALQHSAWALFSFCRYIGALTEGSHAFQPIADQAPLPAQPDQTCQLQPHAPRQSKLVAIYAYLLMFQSKLDQAIVVAQQALALAQAEDDTDATALSQLSWGQALRLQGRLADAQPHLEQTLQLARQAPASIRKSELLYDAEGLAGIALGALASDWGLYQQARAQFGRSLHLARTLGKRRLEMTSLLNLANLDRMAGKHTAARQGYEGALRLTREVGYRWGEGTSQLELGDVLRLQGESSRAVTLLENALTILQEIQEHDKKAIALTWLGLLYAYLGNSTAAEGWLTSYQQFAEQAKGWEAAIHHLQARTVLALHQEKWAQALAYATEGWQIGQIHNLPDLQAYALIGMGHAQSQLGVWSAAATAYQQAFDLYTSIQRPDLAVEAQAGLAVIAQQQGEQRQALGLIEAVLAQLAKQPTSGQDEPFFLYLTCYQLLAAAQDPRALAILQQGYALLQRYVEQITADALRRSFLENVPVHRALQQAYRDAQPAKSTTLPVKEAEQHNLVQEVVPPVIAQTAAPPPPAPSLSLPPLLDWDEMPAVDFFAGRTAEMAQLIAWLTPEKQRGAGDKTPVQLISVLGMGGIGKTTLAAAVTKAVAPNFAVVIWRSLLNTPSPDELLRDLLQILSRQTLTTLPESFDEQLRQLLVYLCQERCLLVLDNVEGLLAVEEPQGRAGEMRLGYEGYDQLLQRLASSDHQSCLLLTSREQPYALLRLGRQAQETGGRIRVLSLTGLDRQAGNMLLQSNGLHASAEAAAQLVDQYSGNPLALQIVAATITDFFGGDVAAFQAEEGSLFDGIRLVLEQQFARLSRLERDILVWLAIEREPMTAPTLRSNFVQAVSTRELIEALQALQNRSLLEKRDTGFTLQNVIIEYTTEDLVGQVYQELEKSVECGIRNAEYSALCTPHSALNRFALLKAQAKAYVRQSQARLIVQPLIERLLIRSSKADLISGLRRLIAQLQAEPTNGAGYAAGNVLNLLVQLGVDLQGYDFSRLTIRQAYLQGATLYAVSLANADLQQCVFTTTFGAVLSLALSPDDQLLAAAANDWMVRVWRLSDGQPYQSYAGHTNVVRSVAFSPDGRWLASASLDQTVRLWDVATGQLRCVLQGHTAGVYSAVFCQNGSVLASAGRDGVVRLWDVNTGQLLRALHGHTDRIYQLAVDPKGALLASGSADQTVRLWDLATGQCVTVFQEHVQGVSCLAFSPNGAMLASGGAGQQIRLWNVATGQTRQILRGHEHWLRAVAFSPDGVLLASASADHTVRLWDTASGQARGLLQGHANAVWALAFTADGNRLISGGVDHQLRVWDVRNPADSRAINVMQAHVGSVLAVAVSPDGQVMATCAQHQFVRLWAVNSGQQLGVLSGHTEAVKSVVFSPDGRTLVSTGDDGAVLLWDVAQRRALKTLGRHPHHANRVAYHPRGEFVASSGNKDAVRVWDLRPQGGGRLLHSLTPPQTGRASSAFGIAFSPDGCYLASAHGSDTLYVWDVASGKCLYTLANQGKELEWIAWSPNGATLAAADTRGAIYLWDMRMPPPSPIRHTLEAGAYPWNLAFSPDSRLLVSVVEDPVIRLWDGESGVCVQTLSGHTQNVTEAAFLPDSKTLVSSSYDGTLRFWCVQTGELLKTLHVPGPYAGLNITGVTGISEAQKAALRALGAVETNN